MGKSATLSQCSQSPQDTRRESLVPEWKSDRLTLAALSHHGPFDLVSLETALTLVQMQVSTVPAPNTQLVTWDTQLSAGLWAFARSVRAEEGSLPLQCIDASVESALARCPSLAEPEVVLHHSAPHWVPRLLSAPLSDGHHIRLHFHSRGAIGNLFLEPQLSLESHAKAAVMLRVRAVGLNFRDVLNVLGEYPGDPGPPGGDASGAVSKTDAPTLFAHGAQTFGLCDASLASLACTSAMMLAHKPTTLTYEQVCTLPSTWCTTHALLRLARLHAGQSIVVHAAAGGVGLNVTEYAQWLSAWTRGTAGRPHKHAQLHLRALDALSSSRDGTAFAASTARQLGARRLHAVINSLSSDFIAVSFELLAEGGTFQEMGKRNIWAIHRQAASAPVTAYCVIALDADISLDPRWMHDTLTLLTGRAVAQTVTSLPMRSFDLRTQHELAFRALQGGMNTGKIVVRVSEHRTRCYGRHLVTGGTNGLGLLTGRWLAQNGASHLILASRRGALTRNTAADLDAIQKSNSMPSLEQCDAGDVACVQRLVARASPLAGVWHAAGMLADSLLPRQNALALAWVCAPKACGAVMLHSAVGSFDVRKLAFFSSVAVLIGGPGQANYAAANACLDALAVCRRTHGSLATSVQWGAWAEVGMAARGAAAERMAAMEATSGFGRIGLAQGLKALGMAVGPTAPSVLGMMPVVWSRMLGGRLVVPPFLATFAPNATNHCGGSVKEKCIGNGGNAKASSLSRGLSLESVLEMVNRTAGGAVDADQPLMEAGVDSLGAVELRNQLKLAAGDASLPSTLVFDHPTARQLASLLEPKTVARAETVSISASTPLRKGHCINGASMLMQVGATSACAVSCMVAAGCNTVVEVPAARWEVQQTASARTRHGGFVRGAAMADNAVFNISTAEAMAMDPCQRLVLEHGYAALHDAALNRALLSRSLRGVFLGFAGVEWGPLLSASPAAHSVYAATGATASIACGRVSFALGLHGPCVSYDTACSAALTACHAGLRALQLNECAAGLAVGVTLVLVPATSTKTAVAGMTSVRGRSHTFDARADGYVRSEACGSIALATAVSGVALGLEGSAVRQDGRSASLTAPSGQAQQGLLVAALRDAGMAVDALALHELHGTGTALGDPIEAGSLAGAVLKSRGEAPLAVCGVKANVGHGEPAAGMTGLLVLALGLQQGGKAAPNAQLRVLNPFVFEEATCLLPVQMGPLITEISGGVSSFGYSGTIAHTVLSHAPHADMAIYVVDILVYRRRSYQWRQQNHPFAHRQMPSPSDAVVVFCSPTTGAFIGLVADHIVMNHLVFPGTGYLEMMRAAVQAVHGSTAAAETRGVTFERMCLVEATVQMECQIALTGGSAEVTSLQRDSSTLVHSRARGSTIAPAPPPIDISGLVTQSASRVAASVGDFYGALYKRGQHYGPLWKVIATMWTTSPAGWAMGRLRSRGSSSGPFVHPADLDAALQLGFADDLASTDSQRTQVPFAIDQVLMQAIRRDLWAVAQAIGGRGSTDAHLHPRDARRFGVQISRLRTRFVPQNMTGALLNSPRLAAYSICWEPSSALINGLRASAHPKNPYGSLELGSVLIIGAEVLTCAFPSSVQRFAIQQHEWSERLLAHTIETPGLSLIAMLFGGYTSGDCATSTLELAVIAAQQILQMPLAQRPSMAILSLGSNTLVPMGGPVPASSVGGGAAWGFGRSILMEGRPCLIADIATLSDRTLGMAVQAACEQPNGSGSQQIAVDGSHQWAPRLRQGKHLVPLVEASGEQPRVVPLTAFVTGGLGGLGISLAPFLMARGASKVVLTSRGGQVARGGQGLDQLLQKLLTQSGQHVITRACDSSSIFELISLLALSDSQEQCGLIHMPHVNFDAMLTNIQIAQVSPLLSAKAGSAWRATAVLAQRPLMYGVLFSSGAAFGAFGASLHAAGNSYLDALSTFEMSNGASWRSVIIPLIRGAGAGEATFKAQAERGDAAVLAAFISVDELAACLMMALQGDACTRAPVAPSPINRETLLLGFAFGAKTTLTAEIRASPQEERSSLHREFSLNERFARTRAAVVALEAVVATPVGLNAAQEVIIIGCGLTGLAVACAFGDAKADMVMLEKSSRVGGVWSWQANATSKTNTTEPAYRLPVRKQTTNTPHSPTFELLDDMRLTIQQYSLADRIYLNHAVRAICRPSKERRDASSPLWQLDGRVADKGAFMVGAGGMVVVCVNRRLGRPRKIRYHGQDLFKGIVKSSLANDCDDISFSGKRVVIVGMGAFAIEKVRTSLERGAAHAQILCRQHGLVCPEIIDYLNFIRPYNDDFEHPPSGGPQIVRLWSQTYANAGAQPPETWAQGIYRPDGYTASVSDLYFLAHYFKRVGTKRGSIRSIEETSVRVDDDARIAADILITAYGFDIQMDNERLLGRSKITSFGMVASGLWCVYEPHLDKDSTGSPFGAVLISVNFTARLLTKYWRNPSPASALEAGLPKCRVNHMKLFENGAGLKAAMQLDPDVRPLLRQYVHDCLNDFMDAYTPEEFCDHNQEKWHSVQDHFRERAPAVDIVAPNVDMPYLFEPLLDLLEKEAPHLLTDGVRAQKKATASISPSTTSVAVAAASKQSDLSMEKLLAAVESTLPSGIDIDQDSPFMEIGLDSIGAMSMQDQLDELVGGSGALSQTFVFDHPTLRSMWPVLNTLSASSPQDDHIPNARAAMGAAPSMHMHFAVLMPSGISTAECAWRVAACASNAIQQVPTMRWELATQQLSSMPDFVASGVRYGGFIDGVELFDNLAFGVLQAEAADADPQQRLILEQSYLSLHGLGLDRAQLNRSKIGVFIGISGSDYNTLKGAGADLSMASSRLSYALGLQGPAGCYNTACSSFLAAGHAALSALMLNDCPTALLAASNLMLTPATSVQLALASLTSPCGHSCTFDARADGYARSEACVASTWLAGDPVVELTYSFVGGSAVRQNGRGANIAAPNGGAQRELYPAAVARAGQSLGDVSCVEVAATGSVFVDSVETNSIYSGLIQPSCDRARPLFLHNIKGSVGHAEPASGGPALTKLAETLAVAAATPNAQLRQLNPMINTNAKGACVLPVQATPVASQPEGLPCGGCSSFGWSGTLVHAVLQCMSVRASSIRLPAVLIRRRFHWRDALTSPAGQSIDTQTEANTPVQADLSIEMVLKLVLDMAEVAAGADVPLYEAGVDSLCAVDLRNKLQERVGNAASLPRTLIFDYPTAREIVALTRQNATSAASQYASPAVSLPESAIASSKGSEASLQGLQTDMRTMLSMMHDMHEKINGPSRTPLCLGSRDASVRRTSEAPSRGGLVAIRNLSVLLPASTELRGRRPVLCGQDGIIQVPVTRWDMHDLPTLSELSMSRIRHTGFVHGADLINNTAFAVSNAEAAAMDPCQRLVLEYGYAALHRSEFDRAALQGSLTGVFLGFSGTEFAQILADSPAGGSVYAVTGSSSSIAAGRLPYVLGLHGPCVSYDTACSAALTACHAGLRALQLNECAAGLAVGVTLVLVPATSTKTAVAGMTSVRGRSHTFDARADGYVRSEACGSIALATAVSGVALGLEGSAVRQDGRSASLTAPSGQAQQGLLVAALRDAGMAVDALALHELHGTGTALGDPIEAGSLAGAVLKSRGEAPLAVCGVKANVGHGEPAAGMTGLLVLALGLQQGGKAAPNAQLRVLNPFVFEEATCLLPVQMGPLITEISGGVSSFGYSGTIAHAVLRAAGAAKTGALKSILFYKRCIFQWRSTSHPFVQRRLPRGADEAIAIYRSSVSGQVLAVVAEHVVNNYVVFPGVGYLEMARAAGTAGAALHGVFFLQPLALGTPGLVVDCAITDGRFEVRSDEGSIATEDAAMHCTGALYASDADRRYVDHASSHSHSWSAAHVGTIYDGCYVAGLQYGPRFRTLIQGWAGADNAAARLQARLTHDGTHVHPADLDDALCVGTLIDLDPGNETRVPFAVGESRLQAAPGGLMAVRF